MRLFGLLLVVAIASGCGKTGPAAPPAVSKSTKQTILVSAASSLTDVLTEIGKDFEAEYPDFKVEFNFASSGALLEQIEQGAPVDVFVSASLQEIAVLDKKERTVSHSELARNELVLIVPASSKVPEEGQSGTASGWAALLEADVKKIAIANPDTTPAGRYAKQALQKKHVWDKVQDKLIFGENVRQTLAYVVRGDVEAGLVFATDARQEAGNVRVVAKAKPGADHDLIIYPAVAIRDRPNTGYATMFVHHASGKKGRETFARYGFLPGEPPLIEE